METYHIPVMLEECITALNIKPDGVYVDLTMGGGGHTREILKHLGPKGHLYSLDQDPDAEANAPKDERHTFVASNFRFVRGALRLRGVERVDGILADLGVSSHHFDAKHRGFSFRGEALLDMRMNTRAGRTAADIVNTYSNEALSKIFAEYGELDTTWKIANCIERFRNERAITTTADLVEAVKLCTPPKDESKFLTKLFQALRIELNGEIEALKMAMEQSLKLLNPEGRLVVMSYHSLEDRIVKNFMRSGNSEGVIEKDFFGRTTTPFKLITRKAIIPSDEEINLNPRSRSAKLRVAERME
ncbi:MAG: 16S rRNA (cytosine(1402)-N(4))-methyltransferase RsmH [Alistipes sp.]|nr:16S rRNA (cytosine(1402)-N(4))-methyltransferase RsmH [Alistipes sp.]